MGLDILSGSFFMSTQLLSYIVVNPKFTHLIFILLLIDSFYLVMAVKGLSGNR